MFTTSVRRKALMDSIILKLSWLVFNLELRGKHNLLDENIHCENFMRDLLKCIHKYNLINLNTKRSNAPGIDLGDENNNVAYQITTNRSRKKVEQTLEEVFKNKQHETYDTIKILILGEKPKYREKVKVPCEEIKFTVEENVLGINELIKEIDALSMEDLEEAHKIVESEIYDIYKLIELDTPKSILVNVEKKPLYEVKNFNALIAYSEEGGTFTDEEKRDKNIQYEIFFERISNLSDEMRKLYCEFLNVNLEFKRFTDEYTIRVPELYKIFHDNIQKFTILLEGLYNQSLIYFEYEDDEMINRSPKYITNINQINGIVLSSEGTILLDIKGFMDKYDIDKQDVFVKMKLDCFSS